MVRKNIIDELQSVIADSCASQISLANVIVQLANPSLSDAQRNRRRCHEMGSEQFAYEHDWNSKVDSVNLGSVRKKSCPSTPRSALLNDSRSGQDFALLVLRRANALG